jgi:hypothetical protein
MLIKRALAGCGWLRLAFIGLCAGSAGGTTFVLALRDEDEILSLVAGYGAGILVFALVAALVEWFWWISHLGRERAWRRSALSK